MMGDTGQPMSQQNAIRVLIVDDYEIVREGLAAMLAGQPDLVLVGTATDGAEALALVQATQPEVVLLDLVLPTRDGGMDSPDSLAALHAIRQARPTTHILMLTSMADEEGIHIYAALRAGAVGYISKDACREHLLAAIRRLTAGMAGPSHPVAE
jgi:DNA-binding NarL/FixJ family response regulator